MTETVVLAPEGVDSSARDALRDLILALADSKRLLGMRYAEWILGAPELEAGIACASMAQDEWGHARQLYSLLRDFGEDVDRLEHGREPGEYRSMTLLDAPPPGWADLVALNLVADGALTVQFQALRSSSYDALRGRCEKLLEEERFHGAHAAAWVRRFAGAGDAATDELRRAVAGFIPEALRWFGPDDEEGRRLGEGGLMDGMPDELRRRLSERLRPALEELGATSVLEEVNLEFRDFDRARRRVSGGAPDAATVARIRGDRNRAFLMD